MESKSSKDLAGSAEVLGKPMGDLIIPEQHRESLPKSSKLLFQLGKAPSSTRQKSPVLLQTALEFDIEFTVPPATMLQCHIFIALISYYIHK
jgi:hypothetical protein